MMLDRERKTQDITRKQQNCQKKRKITQISHFIEKDHPKKMREPFLDILNQEDRRITTKIDCLGEQSRISIRNGSVNFQVQKQAVRPNNRIQKDLRNEQKGKNKFWIQGKHSMQLVYVVESDLQLQNQNPKTLVQQGRDPKRHTSSSQSNKSKKLMINEAAIQHILKLYRETEPLKANSFDACILSIVGKTKTGKSHLLNEIINLIRRDNPEQSEVQYEQSQSLDEAFSVNHTLAPCTKGIWISNQSIKLNRNEKSKNVIFLDSAGFGSHDSTQEIDFKLMTLCILLSDVLCYNTVGVIDEQTINGISVAVQISKLMKNSNQKQLSPERQNTNFNENKYKQEDKASMKIVRIPSLLWFLRDFTLQLSNKDNHIINPDEYLENCLSVENTKSKTSKSKQNIRSAVKSLFKERKCCTLVMPNDEERKKRPQFQSNLEQVKQKLKDIIFSQNRKQSLVEDFVCKLRACVEFLNGEDQRDQKSNSKKSVMTFPKIENLEIAMKKNKLIHEFKKTQQKIRSLEMKYLQKLESDNSQSDLTKVRQSLNREVESIQIEFQSIIMTVLGCGHSLQYTGFNKEQNPQKEHDNKVIAKEALNCKQITDHLSEQGVSKVLILMIEKNLNIHKKSIEDMKHRFQSKYSVLEKNLLAKTQELFEVYKKADELELMRSQIKQSSNLYDLETEYMKIVNQLNTHKNQTSNDRSIIEMEYLRQKVRLLQKSKQQNVVIETSKRNPKSGKIAETVSQNQSQSKTGMAGYTQCGNCDKSLYVPYIIIPSARMILVNIIKTIIKPSFQPCQYLLKESVFRSSKFVSELQQSKIMQGYNSQRLKCQFSIEVELNGKKWYIRRKLKDFVQLNQIIAIMFDLDQAQTHSRGNQLKLQSLVENTNNETQANSLRKELERYLKSLINTDRIRNSRIFQKFIKINKQYIDF